MKIAIDISQIQYQGTGVANYTKEFVRSLLEIDKKNQYLLFGMSLKMRDVFYEYFNSINKSDRVELKILPIPSKMSDFLWNKIHRISINLFLGQFDLLHSSDWTQPLTSAKKITTVHDLVVFKYPETSHPTIINTQKKRLFWVKKECDKVIVDSNSTRQDLIDILDYPKYKIEVVYPGIANEYFDKGISTDIRSKYHLFHDYILIVGTQEPRKNLRLAYAAFDKFLSHPLISNIRKEIDLVIVGKFGWGEAPKAHRNIRIIGYVNEKDLLSFYKNAMVFVYPSLYEGFGLPVLEAMSCGCPVITSDCGSLKEIAQGCALLINPKSEQELANSLVKIYIDSQLREKLIKKGLVNAQKFTWKRTAERILQIYESLF